MCVCLDGCVCACCVPADNALEQGLQQNQSGAQLVFVALSMNADWWTQMQRAWASAADGTVVVITGGRGDIKVCTNERFVSVK